MERCTSDTKVSSYAGVAYFVRLGKHGAMYFRHKSFILRWSCLLCEVGQTWSDVLQTQKFHLMLELLTL